MAADPKPARRITATVAEWERIRARLPQCCQMCWMGGDHGVTLTAHHIVPRSAGGDDVIDNLAVLCGHGTAGCHGRVEARTQDSREALRQTMTPAQVRYVLGKKGQVWLDRHYPSRRPPSSFNVLVGRFMAEGRDPVEAEILAERELGAA